MPARLTRRVRLVSHPGAQSAAISGLDAEVSLNGADELVVRFLLQADLQRLRIPPAAARPERSDDLWRHTCFEAFLMRPPSPGYLELNFSPAGDWAAYAFDSYRTGMRPAELAQVPRIEVARREGELDLRATLVLPDSTAAAQPIRMALTAVIEDDSGSLYYWSLRHPAGKPDFHHADNYQLELPP
jgi:hypothetical protein